MAYRCDDCGNTKNFRVIYDATITEYIKNGEEDEDNAGDVNKIEHDPLTECDECGSYNVDTDCDPIGELPRDHPARRDMGGTGFPEDYPEYNRRLESRLASQFDARGGRGVGLADQLDAVRKYIK